MGLYSKTMAATATLLSQEAPDRGVQRMPEQARRRLFQKILLMRPWVRLIMIALGTLFALCGLLVPVFQKNAVDSLVVIEATGDLTTPAQFFVLSFVALVAARGIEMTVRAFGLREGLLVERWISTQLYRKALALRTENRRERTVGETVTLMASHLSMVSFFLTELFPMFFTSAIPIIAAPFMITYYFDLNPVPVFCLIGVSVAGMVYFAKVASSNFQRYKISDEERLGVVNEWIQNIKSLKLLGWVTPFEGKLKQRMKVATRDRVKVVTWAATMNTFAEMIPMLLNVVGVTTLLLTRPEPPSPGEVLGILWVLAVFLAVPMRALPWVFVLSMDAKTSLARIEEYLQTEDETDEHHSSRAQVTALAPQSAPAFQVENLRVQLGHTTVLEKVSFRVEPRQFVTVVGDVGAGKTMLLHALMGEVPYAADKYEINGQSANQMKPGELRQHFSYTPQEAFVFGASLRENVEFDFTEQDAAVSDRVHNSLDYSSYGPDLEQFELGIETPLGERGVNLSGGQKQRLALARAHFADRPIILMDDTLSALDADTEEQVVERLLLEEWQEYTRILVTHRLSVLPHSDLIIFLNEGKIVAQGSWQEMQKHPDFVEFVKSLDANSRKNKGRYEQP